MPGLIETHVHLVILGDGDYVRWFAWIDKQGRDTMLPRVMAISAKELLMAGITTAVDLGAPLKESLAIRDRIAKGEIPGPRMMMSGPWLTRTPAIFPLDYQIKVTSPEQAGQETEKLAEAGVDVIKAHAGLTFDDYKAIVARRAQAPPQGASRTSMPSRTCVMRSTPAWTCSRTPGRPAPRRRTAPS